LPAGLQIIGPTQGDLGVLQIGLAYDRASGFSNARSPLLG
jgi:amidase